MSVRSDTLDLRLMVYEPNGALIGPIPDVISMTNSRELNDVPTLTFTYSLYGANAKYLDQDVEIAVQWNDGGRWREDINSRFIVLSSSRDEVSPTQEVTYNCVGYSWIFSKATVVVDKIDVNPDNNKRAFKGQSVGRILRTLFDEARDRGVLPGIYIGFTADEDSSGDKWHVDETAISFDRGTDLLSVLTNLADQGMIDWCVDKRTLHVYNAGAELAQPRANRRAVSVETEISPSSFLSQASSDMIDYDLGGRWRHKSNDWKWLWQDMNAFVRSGAPRYTDQLYTQFMCGKWDNRNREVSIYRQMGTSPVDGVTRATGFAVADTGRRIRYALVLPDPGDVDMRALALDIFDEYPGGVILANGASGQEDWYASTGSCFHSMCGAVIDQALPTIVLDKFTATLHDEGGDRTVTGIVQNGNARNKHLIHDLVIKMRDQNISGFQVADRSDKYKYKGLDDRDEWLKGKLWKQSNNAAAANSAWARVMLHSNIYNTVAKRNKVKRAIVNALPATVNSGLRKVNSKPSSDPDVTVEYHGPVIVRYNRDLEAPTTRSVEDYAAIAYGYGDSFAEVKVENDDADLPWGKWEVVFAQGGLEDPEVMRPELLKAIDHGKAVKLEVSRRISLRDAQFLPYRDYDPGDYVLCQTADETDVAYRVKQIVVERTSDAPDLIATIVMEDIYRSREEKMARAVVAANGTVGGSARVGGAGVKPHGNPADNRIPSIPPSIRVIPSRLIGADGVDRPALNMSWDPVTTATNGGVMDVASYILSVQVGDGHMTRMASVPGVVTQATLVLTDTDRRINCRAAVAAEGSNGRVGENRVSELLHLKADSKAPPVPTVPILTSRNGNICATWDGELQGTTPGDFNRVELLMSKTATVRDRPANVVASLSRPGIIAIPNLPYNDRRWFAFVSVDFRGNRSKIGPRSSASAKQLANSDIAGGITFNKLAFDVQKRVTTAMTTADGKNNVFYSPSTPNGDGNAPGDVWFQTDKHGVVTRSYYWDGQEWISYQFGNEVLNSLTAGKIVSGRMDTTKVVIGPSDDGKRVEINRRGIEQFSNNNTKVAWWHADELVLPRGSVRAEMLQIGQGQDNMLPGASFMSLSAWGDMDRNQGSGKMVGNWHVYTTNSGKGVRALQCHVTSKTRESHIYSRPMPVIDGHKYHIGYTVYGNWDSGNARVWLYWLDGNFNLVKSQTGGSSSVGMGDGHQHHFDRELTAPPHAQYLVYRPYISRGSSVGKWASFIKCYVRSSVGGVFIEDGAVDAHKLSADAIDGKVITGATIRTNPSPAIVGGLQLDKPYGLRVWDSSGYQTGAMEKSGLFLVRSSSYNRANPTGVRMEVNTGGWNGLMVKRNGNYKLRIDFNTGNINIYDADIHAGNITGARFTTTGSDPMVLDTHGLYSGLRDMGNQRNVYFDGDDIAMRNNRKGKSAWIFAGGNNGLRVTSSRGSTDNDDTLTTLEAGVESGGGTGRILLRARPATSGKPDALVRVQHDSNGPQFAVLPAYTRTTGSAANVYVTPYGTLYRSTSSERYKVDIDSAPDMADAFLGLPVRTWFDRPNAEHYAKVLDMQARGEDVDWANEDIQPITPNVGFIAEDVDKAGLKLFVHYDDQGRPDALSYPTMIVLAQQALVKQNERIAVLETQVTNLMEALSAK